MHMHSGGVVEVLTQNRREGPVAFPAVCQLAINQPMIHPSEFAECHVERAPSLLSSKQPPSIHRAISPITAQVYSGRPVDLWDFAYPLRPGEKPPGKYLAGGIQIDGRTRYFGVMPEPETTAFAAPLRNGNVLTVYGPLSQLKLCDNGLGGGKKDKGKAKATAEPKATLPLRPMDGEIKNFLMAELTEAKKNAKDKLSALKHKKLDRATYSKKKEEYTERARKYGEFFNTVATDCACNIQTRAELKDLFLWFTDRKTWESLADVPKLYEIADKIDKRWDLQPIQSITGSTLGEVTRGGTAPCHQASDHILTEADKAIEHRLVDAICYRFMQAHKRNRKFKAFARTEASMALGAVTLGLAGIGAETSKQLIRAGWASVYTPYAIAHSITSHRMSFVVEQCGKALSKLLGDDFVKRLYRLQFDEAGLQKAIDMLKADPSGLSTWFLRSKLDELKKNRKLNEDGSIRLVQTLQEIYDADELPQKALAENELLEQIEDLPKRAGQILTILAVVEGRLDVLLAASLLTTSPESVEQCVAELESAGYLRGGSIATEFLREAVMRNVPEDSKKRLRKRISAHPSQRIYSEERGAEESKSDPSTSSTSQPSSSRMAVSEGVRLANEEIQNGLQQAIYENEAVSEDYGMDYVLKYEKMLKRAKSNPYRSGSFKTYLVSLDDDINSWREFEVYYMEVRDIPRALGERH
jgi:hypothetical protein